ncbi:MAG TPA: sigma-70 family RNA polymerase sigma factor [Terriglobia bacterium]|nr:sigma-70 family RNA polymerase sigma factor [Terriglobia bacterium]
MSNLEIGFELAENEVAFVDRLQIGSEEAFETLIHLYQTPIYNIAYRILGDPSEAAEAVQETFMKIYKAIKSFRGDSGLKTWIYKIAISESLNRHRWWKRWRKNVIASLDEPLNFSENGPRYLDVPDNLPSPESYYASRETERAVQKALDKLPFDFRIVVVLRDIEGMSYEDIGETLKLSQGTVKSRLWRGRLELKTQLHHFIEELHHGPVVEAERGRLELA